MRDSQIAALLVVDHLGGQHVGHAYAFAAGDWN